MHNEEKKFLRRIELYDTQINDLTQEIETLRSMATKITACMNQVAVSGSGNQDKLGDAVAKIIDLEGKIYNKVCQFTNSKWKIIDAVGKLEDTDQVKVLHKRYSEYKPWDQIAVEMECTTRNVHNIHSKALQAVEGILKGNGVESEKTNQL